MSLSMVSNMIGLRPAVIVLSVGLCCSLHANVHARTHHSMLTAHAGSAALTRLVSALFDAGLGNYRHSCEAERAD